MLNSIDSCKNTRYNVLVIKAQIFKPFHLKFFTSSLLFGRARARLDKNEIMYGLFSFLWRHWSQIASTSYPFFRSCDVILLYNDLTYFLIIFCDVIVVESTTTILPCFYMILKLQNKLCLTKVQWEKLFMYRKYLS